MVTILIIVAIGFIWLGGKLLPVNGYYTGMAMVMSYGAYLLALAAVFYHLNRVI